MKQTSTAVARQMLAMVLCLAGGLAGADEAPQPLRILLITGGCCHDYTIQKQLISKGLEERALVDVEVVQQGGTATNSKIEVYERENWAEGFDLVIHDECFSDVKDIAWVDNILRPHRAGLPAVVIHCAMHCYRDGREEWFKFCGVTSHRHGAHYPHEVLNRDAAHPIMQGFPAAWANPAGELYWIEKVWETAHPLASAKNREKGNEEVCVWTNQYGPARVFGTTLGHHNETVASPELLDLLTRGVLWAANKLDDPRYLKQTAQQVRQVPVNLALGKPVRASSEETGKNNFAGHAVDGKANTRWCASDGSAPQWLQIDLQEPQALRGCELQWESSSAAYRYRVEGSLDGQSWETLVDRSRRGESGQHQHQFNAAPRFVRVTFLGSDSGGWGSLWEVKLTGDKVEEIDPAALQKAAETQFLSDVTVPEGFEATLFARPPAVQYPVFVAAAPDGTVYVSVDKNGSLDREPRRGAIYRLRDLDGDGRADEVKLFVPDVDSPRGLVWDHDRLYVLHPPHLSAFIDHDADGIADEQQILVHDLAFGFKDRPADHTSNGVTLGVDGWLYLAIGDFGFLRARGTDGTELQFRGGGVVRVRPDGRGLQVYSRGTRNNLEVALDPFLNGFTRDNTNDGDGWDTRLHHFTGLEHHGYPSLYKNFADEIIQPLADYGGGSGCGGLFLDDARYPEGYRYALYTADWGRNIVYRHQLKPRGATFEADQEEFLKVTRVTDLDVDALGNLYVTSWKGATFTYNGEDVGYLLRVRPQGVQPRVLPDVHSASRAELIPLLGGDSHRLRLLVQRELLRRGLDSTAEQMVRELILSQEQPLAGRVAALFLLKQARGVAAHEFLAQVAVREAQLRPFATRALGDRLGIGGPWQTPQADSLPLVDDPAAPMSLDGVAIGLHAGEPRARLESLVAVARLQLIDIAGEVAKSLGDADPVISHTAVQALIQLGAHEAAFGVIDVAGPADPRRAAALRVLQGLHQADVVTGLRLRLERETDPQRAAGLFTALCRLMHREGEWKGNSWGTRPDTTGPYYQPTTWEQSPAIRLALEAHLARALPADLPLLLQELNRHQVELDSVLPRVLSLVKQHPELVPVAVSELNRLREVPKTGVELLIQVADSANADPELRSRAAQALLKSSSPQRWAISLSTLAGLDRRSRGARSLWDRLRTDAHFFEATDVLAEATASQQDDLTAWAYAGLLTLSAGKETPPAARDRINHLLDHAWQEPLSRAHLLAGVQRADFRFYEEQIRAAVNDAEPRVQRIAKEVFREWKLEAEPTPAGPRIQSLPVEQALQEAIGSTGDAARGEYLFNRLNCAKCHTVRKDEALRGPYLPQVARTYNRTQLAESILLPSKSIAQGFVTEVFQTDDGLTHTGFVTRETAEEVVIRDAEAREIRLPVESIEARVKQPVSLMPEGLAKDLTIRELASLLDYLQSLKD
jgi:putative membrane-bound dehydrogenase-like protein